MGTSKKTQIVIDACRRYPQFGTRTIAQFIVAHNPGVFNSKAKANNSNSKQQIEADAVEVVRSKVRYYRGQMGAGSKNCVENSGKLIGTVDKMPVNWITKTLPYKMPEGSYLVLSDVHAPMHEYKPIVAAIAAGQIEKVDGVVFNGDFQDSSAVGFWPSNRRVFMEEFEVVLDLLDFIRSEFPDKTKFYYKLGNHENRLQQYYRNHAPELAASPLASLELMFGFESRDIEVVDLNQSMLFGKLPVFHGHEFRYIHQSVNPARGLFLKTHNFAMIGHCHKPSMHPGTDWQGNLLTTWSLGCCCDLHPEYMPYGNEWSWGFALINVEKNGDFEVLNRRVLQSGQVV
jgi:predicted phosphodiesterase